MKATLDVLQQNAPYLNSWRNKLIHIGFLTVFTLIFLTVYNPFNMSEWGGSMLGYVLIGTPVLLISQFFLRSLLGFQKLTLFQLILWALAEIFIITLGVYLIYGPHFPSLNQKLDKYLLTLKYVMLIIASPYLLSVWVIASRQKLSTFQNFDVRPEPTIHSKFLSIRGENNKVVFAIDSDQIVVKDYLGRNISKSMTATKLINLDVTNLKNGIYYISIFSENEIQTSRLEVFK
jgi:hypothetical protein